MTLCTVAHQAPLSMEFSRQEYWRGLPFPPPGDLPDPGSNLRLLCLLHWQVDSLPTAPPETASVGDRGSLIQYGWCPYIKENLDRNTDPCRGEVIKGVQVEDGLLQANKRGQNKASPRSPQEESMLGTACFSSLQKYETTNFSVVEANQFVILCYSSLSKLIEWETCLASNFGSPLLWHCLKHTP